MRCVVLTESAVAAAKRHAADFRAELALARVFAEFGHDPATIAKLRACDAYQHLFNRSEK